MPSLISLDDLRAAHPDLGVAIYAYEPGGPVVLELLTPDGRTFTFPAPTVLDALAMAFPETAIDPGEGKATVADTDIQTTDIFG